MTHIALVMLSLHLATDTLACEARGSREWLATRASPLDSVTMGVGVGYVRICYSRPHARDRAVFDSLAPYGKVWRTGANEPTTLRLTAPAVISGVSLSPGRYVLLTVPQRERWTVLFYTATGSESAAMFNSLVEVGRGSAPAEDIADLVEQFTIRASIDRGDTAFVLEWGQVRARITVRQPAP